MLQGPNLVDTCIDVQSQKISKIRDMKTGANYGILPRPVVTPIRTGPIKIKFNFIFLFN